MIQTPATLSQEADFLTLMESKIAPFWQQRQDGFISGKDNCRLYWSAMTNPAHTRAVVVINGRIESVCKYQELFFDLYRQGYDIYSFDHRGQGLSQRLVQDREMGYVDSFDDYLDDLKLMLASWPLDRYQHRHLLAHSMGGAIATEFMQQNPQAPFDSMVLSAPMFGVNMAWQLKPFALPLTTLLTKLENKPGYAPGHKAYFPKPFDINPLSNSEVRYHWFRSLYEQHPELKLGGPSSHWVSQALSASRRCLKEAAKLRIPTLLLQAEKDTIVDNRAQHRFARRCPQAKLVTLSGAKHELLFDQDSVRLPAMTQLLDFFRHHESASSQ